MRVLVTGNSGLIGRWVVARLRQEGHEAVGLDKVRLLPSEQDVVMDVGDITDGPFVMDAVRRASPDALIHLAARTDLEEKTSVEGYAANIQGVRNVVAAVRATKSVRRFICTSSQLVCAVGYLPSSVTDYCPTTLYGQSKVLTEKIVREEDGGGVPWCIVRPTTVWGPYMGPHYRRMLQLIRAGRYFHCGKSPLYKSYSYAGNIAYQYWKLLTADESLINRGTFYLADYEALSLRAYTDGLARELFAPAIPTMPLPLARLLALVGDGLSACGISNFPFNSFRLRNILTEYQFDMSEIRKICGVLPYSFDEGIRATAEWYRTVEDAQSGTRRVATAARVSEESSPRRGAKASQDL